MTHQKCYRYGNQGMCDDGALLFLDPSDYCNTLGWFQILIYIKSWSEVFFLMKWMFMSRGLGCISSRSLLVNTKKYLNFPSVSRKHLRTVQTSAIVPAMKSHSIIPAGCCMRSWALTRDWRWIYSGRTLASGAKGRTSWLGLMEPATPFCHPRPCVHLVSR